MNAINLANPSAEHDDDFPLKINSIGGCTLIAIEIGISSGWGQKETREAIRVLLRNGAIKQEDIWSKWLLHLDVYDYMMRNPRPSQSDAVTRFEISHSTVSRIVKDRELSSYLRESWRINAA